MKPQINMIGIITNQLPEMTKFYRDIMGFTIKLELENYIEFDSPGVRFALSSGEVMKQATGKLDYTAPKSGHSFELAFIVETPEEVDSQFNDLLAKGATHIKAPADMPWGQRTAFFSDPDGNIHEIFANLPSTT